MELFFPGQMPYSQVVLIYIFRKDSGVERGQENTCTCCSEHPLTCSMLPLVWRVPLRKIAFSMKSYHTCFFVVVLHSSTADV
jgi:hypothetical protein